MAEKYLKFMFNACNNRWQSSHTRNIVQHVNKNFQQELTLVEPWFLVYQPSEKYEFVSWDDDIPNNMESHQIPWFQTTNQMLFIVEKCRTM